MCPQERVAWAATAGIRGESVQKALVKLSSILSTPGRMESGLVGRAGQNGEGKVCNAVQGRKRGSLNWVENFTLRKLSSGAGLARLAGGKRGSLCRHWHMLRELEKCSKPV